MIAIPVAGAIIAVLVAVWLHGRSNIRLVEKHLGGRERLTSEEFGRRYFPPNQSRLAAEMRDVLAKGVMFPIECLHPDDRLIQDLRMDEMDSLATVEFIMELEKYFSVGLPDDGLKDIRTFRELVELVHRHRYPSDGP